MQRGSGEGRVVHGLGASLMRAASRSQRDGGASARSPRCLRGSVVAVHGRVCEQSQGQASEQQELVLKLWRMLQRRVSRRTLAPMAGCCLGSLSSSF